MRRAFVYIGLLIKRFIKTPVYLALICMIPLMAMGLSVASKQDSGILTIAVFAESQDALARQVVDELLTMDTVLQIVPVDSKAAAIAMVEAGEADASWIFRENYSQYIEEYASRGWTANPPVEVYQLEENEMLLLSRIRLFGLMYGDISYGAYEKSALDSMDQSKIQSMTEAELRANYEKYRVEDTLFNMATVESAGIEHNYMVAPLRGLLCVLITLCGFTAVLLAMDDEERGAFANVYYGHRKFIGVFYVMAACVPAALVSLIALMVAGQVENVPMELLSGGLFVLDSCAFCLCVKRLVRTKKLLASLLPFMTVILLLLTPVFFNLRQARLAQLLLPGFYYMNLVVDITYLWKNVAHFLLLALLCMI